MNIEKISFKSQGHNVVGIITRPDDKSPYVVMLHGFGGSKGDHTSKYHELGEQLDSHGIGTLRFDFRAPTDRWTLDPIESDDAPRTLQNMLSDTKVALEFVRDQGATKIGLLGNSLGGVVALWAAAAYKPDAVVTWSAPIRSDRLPYDVRELRESIDKYDFRELGVISELAIPHRLFHGRGHRLTYDPTSPVDSDGKVPFEDAELIGRLTGGELIQLHGAEHTLNDQPYRKQVVDGTAYFFVKHLT